MGTRLTWRSLMWRGGRARGRGGSGGGVGAPFAAVACAESRRVYVAKWREIAKPGGGVISKQAGNPLENSKKKPAVTCENMHMAWNQTEQGRAYRAEYRARNREKLRAQQREYRTRNQEADKERKRVWRAQNPEKARAQELRARQRRDPQKATEQQRVSRASRHHGLRPAGWAVI